MMGIATFPSLKVAEIHGFHFYEEDMEYPTLVRVRRSRVVAVEHGKAKCVLELAFAKKGDDDAGDDHRGSQS